MRIRDIHVDHFGILRDVTIPVPDTAGPFVILGENEAGKSTLLAFLRAVLLGIPKGRPKDETIYPMADTRIGALDLDTGTHGRLLLERRRGPHGGGVTLTDADGNEKPPEVLREVVGGVDRELYRLIYGFSLQELQDVGTVTGDAVAGAFHAATMGTDRAALQQARAFLDKQLNELFKPNGRTQVAAQLLSELDAVERALRAHDDNLETFNRLRGDRARHAEERQALKDELDAKRHRADELGKARRAWSSWVGLRHAEAMLEDLPPVPDEFPEDAAARLESLREKREAAETEVRSAQQEQRQLETELEELAPARRCLPKAREIRTLQNERSAVRAAREEIPALEQSAERARQHLEELLHTLGNDWTPERLEAADRSVEAQHRLRTFAEQTRETTERLREKQRQTEELRTALDEHRRTRHETERELREELTVVLGTTPAGEEHDPARIERLGQAPGLLRELRAARPAGPAAEDAGGPVARLVRRPALPLAACALVLFGASGVGAVASAPLWGAGALVAGVLCAGFAILAVALSARAETGRQADVNALERDLAAILGAGAAERWSAHELEPRIRRIEGLRDRLRTSQTEEARLSERLEQAVEGGERIQRAQEDQGCELRKWLAEHGLPETASAELALDMLDRIGQAIKARRDVAESEQRLARRRETIHAFEQAVEALRDLVPEELLDEPAETQVEQLAEDLAAEQRKRNAGAALQRRLRDLNRAAQQHRGALEDVGRRRENLFAAAGAKTEAEFLRVVEVHRQRAECRRQVEMHQHGIRSVYGPDRLDEARQQLAATDPDRLELEETEATKAIREAEERLQELDHRLGTLDNEIERMATDDELERLKAQRSALVARLNETAREWIALRTAEHLIGEARRRFEEEQQPEVMRAASRHFESFTDGRYKRVLSELDDRSVLAVQRRDGTRIPTDALSRGTAEQLYLALRLGYIETSRSDVEPLPVIMDDILVNFDPSRQQAAARAIRRFAEKTQVIYFTCHPSVADLFASTSAATGICRLKNGTRLDASP